MYVGPWIPGPDVTHHTGCAISPDDDFFVPPPAEIGRILSVDTALKQSTSPTPVTRRRVGITLATGTVVLTFIWLLSLANWKPEEIRQFWSISLSILGIAMLLAWLHEKPRYACSYVGTNGFARFACYGSRDWITLAQVCRFDQCAALKASLRNLYVNWGYVNTHYAFRWFDSAGHLRARLCGTHHSRQGRPSLDDPYYLARGAEAAWTALLVPSVMDSVTRGGGWRFNTTLGGCVHACSDYVEVKGRRIPYNDLDLHVERGFLIFERKSDKRAWYRLDRSLKVAYASADNALAMIRVIENQAGRAVSQLQSATDARYHTLHLPT